MGRKGQCGGTAGGGSSGRKGRLVYNRVIPKFLQRLAGPEYTANPLDAKRHHATTTKSEPHNSREDAARRAESTTQAKRPNVRDGWKEDVEADIRRLQAEGFNVVDGPVTMAGEVKDVPELQHVSERGERLEKGANTAGESGKSLGVRGGIEKKRVSTGKVANAFGVKNRQKLSFVESDSDSESS